MTEKSDIHPSALSDLPQDVSVCAGLVDQIDDRIIALLGDRFRYSRQIGKLKAHAGFHPLDPQRIRTQKARFVQECFKSGLSERMAQDIINTILQQVITERVGPHQSGGGMSDDDTGGPS